MCKYPKRGANMKQREFHFFYFTFWKNRVGGSVIQLKKLWLLGTSFSQNPKILNTLDSVFTIYKVFQSPESNLESGVNHQRTQFFTPSPLYFKKNRYFTFKLWIKISTWTDERLYFQCKLQFLCDTLMSMNTWEQFSFTAGKFRTWKCITWNCQSNITHI